LAVDGAHQVVTAFREQSGGRLLRAAVERGRQNPLRLRLPGTGCTGFQMLFEAVFLVGR
jgi:hypothetical protein